MPCVRNHPQVAPSSSRKWANANFRLSKLSTTGTSLALRVTVEKGRATFDFSGSAPARPDNLNATEAIATSAVCYWFAVLIGKDLPLNEGLLEPVT